MTFWGHVEALRSVLLRAGVVLAVLTGVFFLLMPDIFDSVILAPTRGDFVLYRLFDRLGAESLLMPDLGGGDFHVELINIQLASQFFIHMSTSFWLAVVFAFPIIIYMVWGFVAPALYQGERKGVGKAFLLGNVMFFIGVAVGYFVVFPVTLRFLADYQVSAEVPNQISLDSYMDNFTVLILVMGIVFELPLLAWLLGRMGLVSRSFFRAYRRHAVAVLLILAAVITPTGDPFTLMVVFLPVYGLWEFSAMLVPKKLGDEADEDDDDTDGEPYVPTYKSAARRE
ncbi:MAG: twin-arginine translocase subunit TatC [Bacteroidales bacterium]|nr:twin-arginine translocase subunit TatC [Bacteroidales bacterium]MBD5376712.1 twin-arginine translocase subunit TatC [Bacteroides sp.]